MSVHPVPHSRPWLTEAECAAMRELCISGTVASGERAAVFAAQAAALVSRTHGLLTMTGTQALTLAIRALCLPPGAHVIIPTYVCRSVAQAVRAANAQPILCDVDQHGLMTAETVAAVATTDTAAVICVHLFGQLADTCSIRALGWPVIDDCCQAAGVPVPPGTLAVLSFHATKCLTTGEGGLVAFDEASMIPRLRQNDDTDPRFSDVQAALGLVQIERYPVMLARRHAIHSRYRETLASIGVAAVSSPAHLPPPFRFTVACPRGFEWTANAFAAHDVIVRRGVDALLHRSAGLSDEAYPGAVQRFAHTCSVPAHASLTDQEIDRVSQAMRLVFGAT